MKKIPLIPLISFFLLIPNTDAAYTKTAEKKYHYYFFSEPYTQKTINVLTNGSTNYTRFADYREWETISANPVTLTNGNTVENSWSLDKFYAMWNELDRRGNVVCKNVNGEDTCSKDLKEKNQNWYYHYHGAYSNEIPSKGDWRGDDIVRRDSGDNTPNDVEINKLSGDYKEYECATLLTKNTLNRVDNNGNAVKDGDKEKDYNNTYISITRQAKSKNDIKEYKEVEENGAGPDGKIIWSGASNSSSGNSSNCGTDKVVATNGNVYSPALYRITTETDKYNCIADSPEKNGECNNTVNVSSKCEKKTFEVVEDGKSIDNPEAKAARVVVGFAQDVTLTNLLTPTRIYQGGGIKIGFIYKSTVTATIDRESIEGDYYYLKKQINNKIRDTLLDSQTIASNISNGATLTFTDEKNKEYKISPAQMQTSCEREGDIISNGKVITTCTIFLPESEVKLGTGKVTYENDIEKDKGINNEFYTPIKYNGELYMSAKFENLTAINGINLDGWMKNITVTYDGKRNRASNCIVNTYPRFYEEDNKTYKFIYRPIDINNPFPNRNAGVNWYSWYEEPANKNRLESSYDKVEYQMELDNQSVSKIKEYNKDKNYLDWKGINEKTGKSDFVRDYGDDTP